MLSDYSTECACNDKMVSLCCGCGRNAFILLGVAVWERWRMPSTLEECQGYKVCALLAVTDKERVSLMLIQLLVDCFRDWGIPWSRFDMWKHPMSAGPTAHNLHVVCCARSSFPEM